MIALKSTLVLGGAALQRCDKGASPPTGFSRCGKIRPDRDREGHEFHSCRFSRSKWTCALAPEAAFCRPCHFRIPVNRCSSTTSSEERFAKLPHASQEGFPA